MISRLYFAYDTSLQVSRYAIRMAARCPDRTLRAVHVQTGEIDAEALEAARSQLARECDATRVTLEWTILSPSGTIFDTLDAAIPDSPDTLVVCGTRSRVTRSKYIDGSVSGGFLKPGQRHAMVIRVANPGLAGIPQDVLISVAGHPRGMRDGLPIIELLAPDLESIHVLLVQKLSRWYRWSSSLETIRRLRDEGMPYVVRLERELSAILPDGIIIDGHVKVAKNIAAEIVKQANRVRARMILLRASERSWWERCVSGNPLEEILRQANCDVAIYRGLTT
jgi:nucleotide-binding universal stress UspA family protein